jgi:hypothetical protein
MSGATPLGSRRLTRSVLSIASEGSILSIASSGSVLSIGSVGSACSVLSIGSAASVCSVLSVASRRSVLSSRAADSALGTPMSARQRRMLGAVLLLLGAAFVASECKDASSWSTEEGNDDAG